MRHLLHAGEFLLHVVGFGLMALATVLLLATCLVAFLGSLCVDEVEVVVAEKP